MSGPQTYLSIEDLVHGYNDLFFQLDNFYEKLEVQSVFNILEKLRYNLLFQKTKRSGKYLSQIQNLQLCLLKKP